MVAWAAALRGGGEANLGEEPRSADVDHAGGVTGEIAPIAGVCGVGGGDGDLCAGGEDDRAVCC